MNNTFSFCLSALLLFSGKLFAQESAPTPAKNIQPTIMVIPFVKESQDMRTILESDINLRVAVSKVKEGFDNRGFNTIDFRARVKQLNNDKAMELENRTSLKQEIIELSGADIYIETEATINRSSGGNSVTVIVTAYDAFSGFSLSNKVKTSPKFYSENYEKLTEKACEGLVEEFLNTLQSKFDEIVQNGRIATMSITFAEGSTVDMDAEVGDSGEILSDQIEQWLEKNAYKGYFHTQGVTSTKMLVDELRVPFKDEKGNNYRISKFASEFRQFLKGLGLESTRDIQGNKLFITIN
ncbi:MAG: DUF6175 family protein [Chitinophagales bacterium]|jgi:hypothetical protein